MLKAVLAFCQTSAKIMLIFLKSARGLHKNANNQSKIQNNATSAREAK